MALIALMFTSTLSYLADYGLAGSPDTRKLVDDADVGDEAMHSSLLVGMVRLRRIELGIRRTRMGRIGAVGGGLIDN